MKNFQKNKNPNSIDSTSKIQDPEKETQIRSNFIEGNIDLTFQTQLEKIQLFITESKIEATQKIINLPTVEDILKPRSKENDQSQNLFEIFKDDNLQINQEKQKNLLLIARDPRSQSKN